MKENKGKGPVDEETLLKTQSQPQPATGDKRKIFFKTIDLGDLPSRRGYKKAKHGLSKSGVVKPGPATPPASQQPSIQIHDLDSSVPARVTPSKPTVPISSQPSKRVPINLLENEDLAWERFKKAVTNEDVAVCYDISLKEFGYSDVHDLFKICFHYFVFILPCHISHLSSNQYLQSVAYAGHVKVHSSVQAGYRDGLGKD